MTIHDIPIAGGRIDFWEIFKLLALFFAGYIIGRFL